MGRPSITGDSIVIAIEDDLLVWTDGLISGTNKELVAEATLVGKMEILVSLSHFGPEISASLDDINAPERVVAAMMGVSPGRARILKAPDSVIDLLPFD
jgi:hypothetical protein